MTLKFLKFAFFSLIILSMSLHSCSETDDKNPSQIDRNDFLKGKSSEEIKDSFRKLSANDKFALWDSKLDQLLTQKFPSMQLLLIQELKNEMNNVRKGNTNKFQEAAINLAKITPEQDFILMFSDLNDYNFSGKFISKSISPDYVINDLKNLKIKLSTASDKELNNSINRKRNCSCRWTCWMTGGESSTNCTVTDGGCGFLLIQDCTHYPG